MKRCSWVDKRSSLYTKYHDDEWGKPVHDDSKLFEFLLLESFQAGLSWLTILKKRENFRQTFDNFDINKISEYNDEKIRQLMENPSIIRSRLKIIASVNNAKIFRKIQKEHGTFDSYIWQFTKLKTIKNNTFPAPSSNELSDKISKDLKKRGMKFVGSTIIYSYLQAIGIIDDHEPQCFCNRG